MGGRGGRVGAGQAGVWWRRGKMGAGQAGVGRETGEGGGELRSPANVQDRKGTEEGAKPLLDLILD